MVHPALGLPSQPWFVFLLRFFCVYLCIGAGGACWVFAAVFLFVLLEADGIVSGTDIWSRLHVLGIGKARKVGLWALKQEMGKSLSAEAVAQLKSLPIKRYSSAVEKSPQSSGSLCPLLALLKISLARPWESVIKPREPSQTVLRPAVFIEQILQNMVFQELQ